MQEQTTTNGEEQLGLGIKVSSAPPISASIRRFFRDFQYSLAYTYLRKVTFWVNAGFFIALSAYIMPLFSSKIDKTITFFVSPGLYNAGALNWAFLNVIEIQEAYLALLVANILFVFIAYLTLYHHRSRLSDVVLLVLLLINLVFFKLLVQGLWLWNI